jgi:hypothetical protein
VEEVPNMDRTEFENPKFLYHFHFLHVFVGRVLILASHSLKEKKEEEVHGLNEVQR